MKIELLEDEGYRKLYPLTYLRPTWELVSGATTILEKFKKANPKAEISLLERGSAVSRKPGAVSRNGRVLPSGKEIIYPWDLLKDLKEDLEEDLKFLGAKILGQVHTSAVIYSPHNVRIEKGAVIEANAVLDARQGPIYIGEDTIIHPGALLRGPLSVGRKCKLAGEIMGSIIMDCVNKGHYGFLGHSYVCSWVNLGAGTTNSNLKNNYKNVKVQVEGKSIDSGMQFLGCFIGDHSKTAIGTLIYTGCLIGVAANLFGQPYYKNFVPSFSWGGGKEEAKLEEVIETARAAMKRRGIELAAKDIEALKKVFALTKNERK